MALKPLPKLILIAVFVGGVGYTIIETDLLKKKQPPQTEVQRVSVPEKVQAVSAPAPALQEASETPKPRPTTADSGLEAVLGAGKEKR